jgi:hypothetical protein
VDPTHRRLAQVGLQAAARYGFALAGGYAVQEHGLIQRPSEDVDLFTAWDHRADFTDAVQAVIGAYRDSGYQVEVAQQFETFARLSVLDIDQPDRPFKVELAANWRANPPVVMDIGPVLHSDDVVAGKMSALYTRAEPRDFLDVDAAVTSGRYTRELTRRRRQPSRVAGVTIRCKRIRWGNRRARADRTARSGHDSRGRPRT